MQVKPSQATDMIATYIRAQVVPMIHGSPGIGKSQIVHQIADQYGLQLIDLRLSQCDPTDLAGFPQIDQARQKAGYLPMDTFPLEGEAPAPGYNGWLLFFDEANSAPKAVQAAAYKIILDRKIGQTKLHKNCAMVAAGNLESDGAIVEEMSTALQSRMAHLELAVDSKEWVEWAQNKGLNHRITDYIQFKPGNVYTFKPDHTERTYACPRTWEFADRVMKTAGDANPLMVQLLTGVVGEGIAREFSTFCKVYDKLPKPAQLMSNPEGIEVPKEPSILYALTGTISHNATADNLSSLMKFVRRLPAEFQVVTLRDTIRRNKPLLAHPEIREWIASSAADLF